MTDTVTRALTAESLLSMALDEANDALAYARMAGDDHARFIRMNVTPLAARIRTMLDNAMTTDRPQPDAYVAVEALREACHWSEKARVVYTKSRSPW